MRKRNKQILLRVTEEERKLIKDYAYSVRLNINDCFIKLIKDIEGANKNE